MTKEQIEKKFKYFENRLNKIKELEKKLLYYKCQFIKHNRVSIKDNYMPKNGDIYLIDDYLSMGGKLPYMAEEGKYIEVVNNILRERNYWNYRHEIYPDVKCKILDTDYNELRENYFTTNVLIRKIIKENKKTNVYLMIDKNTGLYKIGRSKNPEYREKTLQSQKPTIEIICYFAGSHFDEKSLHNKFSDKRVRGEWFNLDYLDISFIKNYFNG